MLGKLALLLKGKAAAGVVALLLAGSGGTVVAVAAQTHTGPFANTHASAGSAGVAQSQSQGQGQSNSSHAHTVAVEGVLKAYDADAKTIDIQKRGETTTTTIAVDDTTTVNGDQATSLADLTKNLNHNVQVQADQQADNTLLAWKITVGGPANPGAGNGDANGGNGADHGSGGSGSGDTTQRPFVGSVSSVDISASTFVVVMADGTSVTVSVSANTQYQGSAHSLADLKVNMHVTVKGTQFGGTVVAATIQVGA